MSHFMRPSSRGNLALAAQPYRQPMTGGLEHEDLKALWAAGDARALREEAVVEGCDGGGQSYCDVGNLLSVQDRRGIATNYEYDGLYNRTHVPREVYGTHAGSLLNPETD